MKRLLLAAGALLFPIAGMAFSVESAGTRQARILCGTMVGLRFRAEVDLPGVSDKFKHCALSCVITRICGPMESLHTGVFKEIMDVLGPGDPEIEDLIADIRGIRFGLNLGQSHSREECYQACSRQYPVPGHPRGEAR